MNKEYKVVNGTSYSVDTPQEVIDILEKYRGKRDTRIRVFYGDKNSGIDWNEENDTIGYIGRSTGTVKIPLLISKSNSSGGVALLDDYIVKITVDKVIVYLHPTYDSNDFQIVEILNDELKYKGYTHTVIRNNETTIANFKNKLDAINYISFMQGDRNMI
jgi:hypothetical protein